MLQDMEYMDLLMYKPYHERGRHYMVPFKQKPEIKKYSASLPRVVVDLAYMSHDEAREIKFDPEALLERAKQAEERAKER